MSDFEHLKAYVNSEPDALNKFYTVPLNEIQLAEQRLGFALPSQLKELYTYVGYGYLKASDGNPNVINDVHINKILCPDEIADLYFGEGLDGPEEGFTEGDIPFFQISDSSFLVMRPKTRFPNKVYRPRGVVISDDLNMFLKDLHNNPTFYLERGLPGDAAVIQ